MDILHSYVSAKNAIRAESWNFDVFFDLRPNKRLFKQSRDWWLRHHRADYEVNVMDLMYTVQQISKVPIQWYSYSDVNGMDVFENKIGIIPR